MTFVYRSRWNNAAVNLQETEVGYIAEVNFPFKLLELVLLYFYYCIKLYYCKSWNWYPTRLDRKKSVKMMTLNRRRQLAGSNFLQATTWVNLSYVMFQLNLENVTKSLSPRDPHPPSSICKWVLFY